MTAKQGRAVANCSAAPTREVELAQLVVVLGHGALALVHLGRRSRLVLLALKTIGIKTLKNACVMARSPSYTWTAADHGRM